VTVTLPADARLLFNGTPAEGTGATRTYRTPALAAGQDYAYELTAEVTRNGEVQKVSKRVTVRAGETTTVTLVDDAARTTSKLADFGFVQRKSLDFRDELAGKSHDFRYEILMCAITTPAAGAARRSPRQGGRPAAGAR
jgi:uncharacterized protein (TIGR03000 family)